MGNRPAVALAATASSLLVILALASAASAQDVTAPPPQEQQPVAVAQTPTPPPAADVAASGQKENGFVLEVNIGTRLVTLGGLGLGAFDVLNGGFFAGVKLNDLMLGLGVQFSRTHTSGGGGGDTDATPVVIRPGLRYSFVHSDDHRVDLFGEIDVGIGHSFNDPDINNILLDYLVGPGLRFWAHPQFAVAAVTGVAGEFIWRNGPWGMTDIHSVFAELQLLGVF